MTRVVPRFRQRVDIEPYALSAARGRLAPHFDLDYHLRWTRLPHGGSVAEVLALAEPIGMQAFDRARPLWDRTVVEGLDGGRAVMRCCRSEPLRPKV